MIYEPQCPRRRPSYPEVRPRNHPSIARSPFRSPMKSTPRCDGPQRWWQPTRPCPRGYCSRGVCSPTWGAPKGHARRSRSALHAPSMPGSSPWRWRPAAISVRSEADASKHFDAIADAFAVGSARLGEGQAPPAPAARRHPSARLGLDGPRASRQGDRNRARGAPRPRNDARLPRSSRRSSPRSRSSRRSVARGSEP